MSDWNEFFQTAEFRKYRSKQVELVAEYLNRAIFTLKDDADAIASLKGYLTAADALLRLPNSLVPHNAKMQDLLDMQMVEDMAGLTTHLMRRFINE